MPQALLTLFFMTTSLRASWIDVLYNGIDARGVNLQPKRNNNPWMGLYFVIFMLTAKILILNLFVGILFEKYSRFHDGILNHKTDLNSKTADP